MSKPRRTAWWSLAGLIPCVMATIAESIPARAPVAGVFKPAAELRFAQYGVSYPLVRPYPVIEVPFEFQNRSLTTVTIEEVKPSCGCLSWHLSSGRKSFAPGESDNLMVRMHTANERPGPHVYTIDVKTRGRQTLTQQLTLRVTLPEEKISIQPAEVYFYPLNGQAEPQTVYVTDHRQNRTTPLEITGVESLSKSITAEVRPAETDEQGRHRIPVRLSIPEMLPAGRASTFVRLLTNDAEFTHLLLPVMTQGIYGPPVDPGGLVDVFEWVAPRQAASGQPATR